MQIWQAAFGALVGAVGASFAATSALRALEGRQALVGRSACDACGQPLGFAATVPIASYVFLGGRCQACNAPISCAHPLAETLGLVAGITSFSLLPPVQALTALTLSLVLIATSIIDHYSRRLPDRLTLAVVVLAATLGALKGTLLWGLFAAGVAFLTLETLRRVIRSRRGDPGLGLGDVKLIAALALWLGAATPWAVVAAALLGLMAMGATRPVDGRIAFGPAIAAAAFVVGLIAHQAVLPIAAGGGV